MEINFDLKEVLKTFFRDKLTEKETTLIVTSTYKLNPDDLVLIRKIFSIPTEFKIINIVEPKILGGLILNFASKVIDLSIAGHLREFKKLIT